MAMPNPKNFALSPAAADLGLGLGNMITGQLDEEAELRRKKLASNKGPAGFGDDVFGSAAQMLLGRGF